MAIINDRPGTELQLFLLFKRLIVNMLIAVTQRRRHINDEYKSNRDKQEKASTDMINVPSYRAIVSRILQRIIESKVISNDGDGDINHMKLHN